MPEYHDLEWGYPCDDDRKLFEKICLEGFQSGLSWRTILRKRENFRRAFSQFDFDAVARFDDTDVARLLADQGIVRHRAKILSTINNAKKARELIDETGSLAAWIWKFEPDRNERPKKVDFAYLHGNPATPASERMSKALKKRGWTFVGPTTLYAFMQAVGIVNDHIEGCVCRSRIETARKNFKRPE
ncbi:MAG: DNA-3-methyladenine glycosylase I [Xanthomonadaceae bacterium]|nr:DNA-3-methyladenine glycosylase I [Xanthomonadaceae bacterium]